MTETILDRTAQYQASQLCQKADREGNERGDMDEPEVGKKARVKIVVEGEETIARHSNQGATASVLIVLTSGTERKELIWVKKYELVLAELYNNNINRTYWAKVIIRHSEEDVEQHVKAVALKLSFQVEVSQVKWSYRQNEWADVREQVHEDKLSRAPEAITFGFLNLATGAFDAFCGARLPRRWKTEKLCALILKNEVVDKDWETTEEEL